MNLCSECKHAKAGGMVATTFGYATFTWMCKHPEMREPVRGLSAWACESARGLNSLSPCGRDGKLWEQGAPESLPTMEIYKPPEPGVFISDRPWWKLW